MKTIAILMLLIGATQAQPEITDAEFAKLFGEVKPKPGLWLTIPWKSGLLEGQKESAHSAKPMLIWAMDGHPLGCV